jgi:hypothetical protein
MYISHVHCALRYMYTFVRTSERDGWRRTKSIFSFSRFSSSFFSSLSFSLERTRERVWNSLSFAHIYALLVALLPINLLSTAHRPMKFQNRRVKRAEKTTATTIERKKRDGERENKRPIRWTMMMLATERTSSGVHWTREWWMVGLPYRVRETKERLWEWVRCQQRKLHFHLFLSLYELKKKKICTSTDHYRLDYCPSTTVKGYQSR